MKFRPRRHKGEIFMATATANLTHIYRELPTVSIPRLAIFQSGCWNGDWYGVRDLDQMIDAFPKMKFSPQLKLGPQDGQDDPKIAEQLFGVPSVGRVTKIWREGDTLYASLD